MAASVMLLVLCLAMLAAAQAAGSAAHGTTNHRHHYAAGGKAKGGGSYYGHHTTQLEAVCLKELGTPGSCGLRAPFFVTAGRALYFSGLECCTKEEGAADSSDTPPFNPAAPFDPFAALNTCGWHIQYLGPENLNDALDQVGYPEAVYVARALGNCDMGSMLGACGGPAGANVELTMEVDLFITKAISTAAPYVSPCLQDLGASLEEASLGSSSSAHPEGGLSEAVSQLLAAHPQLAAVATAAAAKKSKGSHASKQHKDAKEEKEDAYEYPGEASHKQKQQKHFDAGAPGHASWPLDASEIEQLYEGVALVASGTITSVTGATNGYYSSGRLQYYVPVMFSSSEPLTETAEIEAALTAAQADRVPLVTGGQMELVFEKHDE